jgi:O-antigen ligase
MLSLLGLMLAGLALVWILGSYRTLGRNFLYAVPALNVLADMFVDVWSVGGVHSGVIRAAVLTLFICLSVPTLRLSRDTVLVCALVGYLALLLPGTSNPPHSFEMWLRLTLAVMMLPIAHATVLTVRELRKLNIGLAVAVFVIVVQFVAAQVFQLGSTVYGEEQAYLVGGNSGVYITYVIAYALVSLPLAFRSQSFRSPAARLFMGGLAVAAICVLFLVFRRGAILGFLVGTIVYVLYTRNRGRATALVGAGAVAMVAAMPLIGDRLASIYSERGDVVAFIENTDQGRMAEFELVWREFLDRGVRHAMFGSDLFNSRAYLGETRTLHVDYTNLLLGAGIVGLGLYLLIFFWIVREANRRARLLRAFPLAAEIRATLLGLVATCLVVSFSTQIWAVGPLSCAFLYFGALLGLLRPVPVEVPAAAQVQVARRPELALASSRPAPRLAP